MIFSCYDQNTTRMAWIVGSTEEKLECIVAFYMVGSQDNCFIPGDYENYYATATNITKRTELLADISSELYIENVKPGVVEKIVCQTRFGSIFAYYNVASWEY